MRRVGERNLTSTATCLICQLQPRSTPPLPTISLFVWAITQISDDAENTLPQLLGQDYT